MSKILLVVATVLVLISAVLGFITMGQKAGLKNERDTLQATLDTTRADVAQVEERVKAAQEEAATARAEAEANETELATATQNLDRANAELQAANTSLEAAKAEVTRLTQELADAQAAPAPQDAPAADAQTAQLAAELKEAQTQLADAQQINESLTSRVAEMQGQMETLREKAEQQDRRVMARGLEGQILAVNSAWNFVVISLGDRQGVVPHAEMIVMRDGQRVGKVKITSVEPSTSIADVVPGSVSRGSSVRPGDRVIYPGA